MTPTDRDALARALDIAHKDRAEAARIDSRLARGDDWFDLAVSARYHCQMTALNLPAVAVAADVRPHHRAAPRRARHRAAAPPARRWSVEVRARPGRRLRSRRTLDRAIKKRAEAVSPRAAQLGTETTRRSHP